MTSSLLDREVSDACARARATVPRLAALGTAGKDAALEAIARRIVEGRGLILAANAADHEAARG